jgi:secreted Zn-dependent insulinase-like peptidase
MEVLDIVFSYIRNCLRTASDAQRQAIREECERIEELNFRFKSKQREDQYTEQLAVNLSRYPRQEVLCGGEIFYDSLDMRLIDQLLDSDFDPRNLRIDLVAPLEELQTKAQLPKDAELETEEWYGTKYHRTAIDEALCGRWDKITPIDGLALPKLNQYTPHNVDLRYADPIDPSPPYRHSTLAGMYKRRA